MSGFPNELLEQYLSFYQDLGIKTVYRRDAAASAEPRLAAPDPEPVIAAPEPPAPVIESDPAAAEFAPAAEPEPAPVAVPVPLTVLEQLEQIRADIGDCRRCRLHEGRNKLVFGVGDPEAKLVFVGEGPGADEDAQGIPFVGRAGQLLTQMIEATASKEGIPLQRKDVYICNVVKCRPPENRTPEPDEMAICGDFLFRQLEAIKPKAICVLGGTAMKALLKIEGITRNRGQWHKWRGIPVMITYHPSYLLRPYNQNAKREAWEDLKKVLHYVYD